MSSHIAEHVSDADLLLAVSGHKQRIFELLEGDGSVPIHIDGGDEVFHLQAAGGNVRAQGPRITATKATTLPPAEETVDAMAELPLPEPPDRKQQASPLQAAA